MVTKKDFVKKQNTSKPPSNHWNENILSNEDNLESVVINESMGGVLPKKFKSMVSSSAPPISNPGDIPWKPQRFVSLADWKNLGSEPNINESESVSMTIPGEMIQGSRYYGGKNKEFQYKPDKIDINKLYDRCNLFKIPKNNKKAKFDINNTEFEFIDPPEEAVYQILETIPSTIINPIGKASFKMNGVQRIIPLINNDSDDNTISTTANCPYQTHAWLVDKIKKSRKTIHMCCMYFTWNAQKCPFCVGDDCNIKDDLKDTLTKLAASIGKGQNPSGEILCGNCINAERGDLTIDPPSPCCNFLSANASTDKGGVCSRDFIKGEEGQEPRYNTAGYAVWIELINAVNRGVKLKVIFSWPAMVDNVLTLKNLLYLKNLNPKNVSLYPLNVTAFFKNDSTQLYAEDFCGDKPSIIPAFTAQTNNIPESGYWACPKDKNDKYIFQGDIDGNFAPTGMKTGGASVDSGILHSKIYAFDSGDKNNCAFYTGAQNATYDGSLEMGIGIQKSQKLSYEIEKILNIYTQASYLSNNFIGNFGGSVLQLIDHITNLNDDRDFKAAANIKNPFKIRFLPESRPDGLDSRKSFSNYVQENCNLSGKKFKKTQIITTLVVSLFMLSLCIVIINVLKYPVIINLFLVISFISLIIIVTSKLNPNKQASFIGKAYISNCPKVYCDLSNFTYDLTALVNQICSAKKFVYITTMDWSELSTYLSCTDSYCINPQMGVHGSADQQQPWFQTPGQGPECSKDGKYYNYTKTVGPPENGENIPISEGPKNIRGPQTHFNVLKDKIKEAAMRGVDVKLLVGQRGKQPCGDVPEKLVNLTKLVTEINYNIKKEGGKGSINVKYFVFLCDDSNDVCFGAFHQKFIVTDRGVAISSSNYVGDYFASTHGTSFVCNTESMDYNPMRDDLKNIFLRNWKNSKLITDTVCQCAQQGWPLSGSPLPGATPHYYCGLPDCGVSSLDNEYGFCNSDCPKSAQDSTSNMSCAPYNISE